MYIVEIKKSATVIYSYSLQPSQTITPSPHTSVYTFWDQKFYLFWNQTEK